jgi:hypothetical protein
MRGTWTVAALFAALFLFGGCREQKPGEHAVLAGKVFIFNYRIAEATYVVTLTKTKPFADGAMAVASFENPAGGAPLIVHQKIWPNSEKIVLESPALTCVRKDRPYAITISLLEPSGAELQRIDTTLTSSLDQDVLPDKPLVVGPVYTPNPELAGNPGGKTGEAKNCPP